MNDSVQRLVNVAVLAGQSSVAFDTPARPLINGEAVKFAGHATEYIISACLSTSFTVAPVLASNIADNELITRLDPYRIVEFDDIVDEYSFGRTYTDVEKVALYKIYLESRKYLERKTDHVFKSRTITEVHSVEYPTDVLTLKYRPVISATSVTTQYLDEAAATIDSDDYSVNTELGTIYYPTGWPVGQNHITVVYVAGWADVEFDHRLNFKQLFGYMWALSPTGKDALMKVGDSKLDLSFRSLEDVDSWIVRNFPQPRMRL